MFERQRTIVKEVSISGIGLHTGGEANLTFKPAEANTGIIFRRVDLHEPVEIPALIDYVSDIARGTILSKGDVKIHTVEHVLAALVGLQIDNVIVELDNSEPPVMDGSSIDFVNILKDNIFEQENAKSYFEVADHFEYKEEDKGISLIVVPSKEFKITYMVDYKNPSLGTQYTTMFDLEKEFVTEFASTRTFCFLSDVENLKAAGLIKGGNLDNSVVILDRELNKKERILIEKKLDMGDGVIPETKGIVGSTTLRFPNEPVRHKALDLIGDLALLGKPIKAHFLVARGGHESHIELVKVLKKAVDKHELISKFKSSSNNDYVFDVKDIMNLLPHRYPMLLVDRILEVTPGKKVVGLKNVTINENFFNGHFPGKPVMPGVLIVEAMGQAGGVLLMNSVEDPASKVVYFTSIDKVKFRTPVIPGDQLIFEVEMTMAPRRGMCKMKGVAKVNGKKAAEALMTAMIIDKDGDK